MIKENENLKIREDVIKIKENDLQDTIQSIDKRKECIYKKHIGEEKPLPSDSTLKSSSNGNNNPLKPEETQKDIEGYNKYKKFDCSYYSLDQLKNIEKKISFSLSVPNSVVKRFKVVKKLIIYSCYEYEFLDVAFERALSTFELALRERYYEMKKTDSEKITLCKLIDWADSKGLFEESKDKIHLLRKFRNSFVGHVKRYSLLGFMTLGPIFLIINTINGLYENVDLKKLRKQEIQKMNMRLENILENGAIFQSENIKKIIFKGKQISFNNKNVPYKYHFAFYPIFAPIETNKGMNLPNPIIISANSYDFKNDILTINDIDGEEVKITRILKKENQVKYDNWRKDLELNESLKDINEKIDIFINYNIYMQ
jgi:hypothetical protein